MRPGEFTAMASEDRNQHVHYEALQLNHSISLCHGGTGSQLASCDIVASTTFLA